MFPPAESGVRAFATALAKRCDAGPPRGAVMTRSRSGVAEGEQLGDRGPVAGGPGGDRAGGPAQQEQGKLAAAEPVRGVQIQGAACDLGGVIATGYMKGTKLYGS